MRRRTALGEIGCGICLKQTIRFRAIKNGFPTRLAYTISLERIMPDGPLTQPRTDPHNLKVGQFSVENPDQFLVEI